MTSSWWRSHDCRRCSAMADRSCVVSLGFVLGLLGLCASYQQVPVLMWSSESSLWTSLPGLHRGHVTTDIELGQYLDLALVNGPRNILLFLQEKLSVEDFTAFGGVYGNKQDSAFPNLESIMESSPSSLVLPAVDWYAANILSTYLKEKIGVSPLYVDQSTLLQLKLNQSIPSLLVVRLPYANSAGLMTAKDVLRANDEVISQVLSTLKSEGVPYVAILTALRPSRVISESSFVVGGLGRQLLEAAQPNTSYAPVAYETLSTPCILFWASNVSVSVNGSTLDLTNRTFISRNVELAGSFCNTSSARLALNYNNAVGANPVTLTFHFSSRFYPVSGRFWFTLDQVVIFYNSQNATFLAPQVSAPSNYSFRCQHVNDNPAYGSLLVGNASKAGWNLEIVDFQIQAFNVTGLAFSYASDCASFFSPGIWMGLLTTLLFVFILTYGLHMIMNLKTMDRFDDPKGPSISVPQTE